jgi:hypothetical protein
LGEGEEMTEEFVVDVLKAKLDEVNQQLLDCESRKAVIMIQMEQCSKEHYNHLLNKDDIITKLKLIDPEGVYE